MNNNLFRFLVILMSLSLVGIILVQVYWINLLVEKNEDHFTLDVKQILIKVSDKLEQREMYAYLDRYYYLKDSIGQEPQHEDFLKFGYYQVDSRTNETVIYSNSIVPENNAINSSFFDNSKDTIKFKNFISTRKTEIYAGEDKLETNALNLKATPDVSIHKTGRLSVLDKAQYEIFFKDIAATKPIEYRISAKELHKRLKRELLEKGINTPFEFAVCTKSNQLTNVKSANFSITNPFNYGVCLFKDNDGISKYDLKISFPNKHRYLFSSLVGIAALSILFTLIIIIVFVSTLNQFIKQRQISEIKTDFINNMTHEFKTPIATINLALDSIKNPKIFEDVTRVNRYLGIIREENKRMNAQVENVLQISKLERRELELEKEQIDVHDLISDASEHVSLLLNDRAGKITIAYNATRSTILANDTHFTNLLVNILENAIKYSIDAPIIEVTTENIKELIIIKIKDHGPGISKSAQSKIFDKFFREHTGNIHNVKGHGLGLAYVKKIIDEHNGEIFVESEKGKGSTFIIKISLIN